MSALDEIILSKKYGQSYTPLESVLMVHKKRYPNDAESAAAELLALRERVEKMAVILQWIYDDGEGGTYRPDIQAVLVAHNQSQ